VDGGERGSGTEIIPLFPLETPLFPGVVLPLDIFEPRYRRLMADLTALPADSARRRFGVVSIRQGWEVERVAPAAALYDVGCTAVVRAIAAQADGGYQVVAVGSDRFRLLDVLVPGNAGTDPPYLRAQVEWLGEVVAAEEAAGDAEGLVGADSGSSAVPEDVVASVARGSLEVLTGSVRNLFARYVAEVSRRQAGAAGPDGGSDGGGPEDDGTAEAAATAELLRGVTGDARALSYLVASAALLTAEDRQALLAESATRRRLGLESRLLRRELTLLRTIGAVPVPLRQFATPMTAN
jgi:Lon protease-like protein